MQMIPSRNKVLGRLTQALVMSLAALAVLILVACAGDGNQQATELAPADQQPTEQQPATEQPTEQQPATEQPTAVTQPTATAASTPASPSPTAAPQIRVVTTTNFVADWARQIGGDRVEVFGLIPAGGDPHSFMPGARDIARVADADLVLTVGLQLEAGWLEELVHNASADESRVIALGDTVDPVEFATAELHDDHGDDHGEMMAGDGHGVEGEVDLAGRLLIGDGETGMMSVIDLEHGDVEQDAFDLGSRAGRIYSTKNGRFAIAVSSDANTAHVFDGGIYLEAHGDHFDLVEDDVASLGIDLSGDRPAHLYVGSEWATIYYDGSGDVVFLNEHELEEEGSVYAPPKLNFGAQHGAAVPLEGDLFAISLQHPDYDSDPAEYRLPIGAQISDLEGNIIHSAEGCEGLHGDAGNGHMAVFGCVGGVLVLEEHGDHFDDYFIGPPAGSPEDFRLTSIWGYPGLDHFFALGSAVGLYLVEPEEGAMEQFIPASEDLMPINVAMSHDGEALLVVMSDGELRMYDAHDLDLLASADDFLTEPVETGFWARPHVATAPGAVFVTDSLGGEVLQLDGHDLEVVNHWDVDGNPTKVAFVGIVGEGEVHGDHGGHGDHHGHDHGTLDPHFWFDPIRVKTAVTVIAAHLSAIDPENRSVYLQNAAEYGQELDELHAWTLEQVSVVAPENRILVTSHDTFSYFAELYGFQVAGLVIPSLGTDLEPSAEHLAAVVEVVREHGVPAVFGETTVSERLARAVARETGAELVQLYSGSMGAEGSSGDTYLGMVRTNVERIVEALR